MKKNHQTPLSKKLKEFRINANLTQKELGNELKLSDLYKSKPEGTIQQYESGIRIPKEEVIRRYAQYFMIHPKYIKELIPEKKPREKKEITDKTRWKIGSGNRGRKQTTTEKEKRSQALKGVPKTPEHKANIAQGKLGQKLKESTKEKISKTKKKKWQASQTIAATYYQVLERNKQGIPTKSERSHYNENGTLIKKELIS